MAKLLFLGRLEQAAGGAERIVQLDSATSYGALLGLLETALAAELRGPRIKVALNGLLVANCAVLMITDSDEIAFLPPVSGG